jgi:hypothetical protein
MVVGQGVPLLRDAIPVGNCRYKTGGQLSQEKKGISFEGKERQKSNEP